MSLFVELCCSPTKVLNSILVLDFTCRTLDPTCKDFLVTTIFLWTKSITSNVKKFGYGNQMFTTKHFLSIFLLFVSIVTHVVRFTIWIFFGTSTETQFTILSERWSPNKVTINKQRFYNYLSPTWPQVLLGLRNQSLVSLSSVVSAQPSNVAESHYENGPDFYFCISVTNIFFFTFTVRKRSLRRLCFYTCLSFWSRGGSVPVHVGIHPPGADPPQEQTFPPGADGYCCGRYAYYWNAFLFNIFC